MNKTPAYICPVCHGSLQALTGSWQCPVCKRVYPVRKGILDFLSEELNQEPASTSQRIRWMDRSMGWLSKIYESQLWYPVFINLIFGWKRASLEQIAHWMKASLPGNSGCLLDVACGPATYGRRLASSVESVNGIDVSFGMLYQAEVYLEQAGIQNVFLARSLAEQLPFQEAYFDAAICAGSLHLFSQPERVLSEIQRTLKPGAPLAVMTLIHGEHGIVRYRAVQNYLLRGIHVFERSELEEMLARTGFTNFQARIFGSGIYFVTNKKANQ